MKKKMKITLTLLHSIIVFSALALSISWDPSITPLKTETGIFIDSRDGKSYKTIKIGDTWLMAENFAYKPKQGNFWAYNNDSCNVGKHGYLYDWETAKNIAPKGWHLPTDSEWKNLRTLIGGKRDVYKHLGGTMEIVYQQMVIGGCGFNALLSGIRTDDGRFVSLGSRTDFWSSSASKSGQYFYTLDGKKDGKKRGLFDSKEGIAALSDQQDNAKGGKSVRLFKD